MKTQWVLQSVSIIAITLFLVSFQKEGKEPWSKSQLMAPAALAEKLKDNKLNNTVVFNIGPSGKIKNSIAIGSTQETENLDLLKNKLSKLSKDTEVVIYCGCCPFNKCPNIRPAFELLNDMNFVNAKLLNMPQNLKADWIDKGYPLQN